MHRRIGKSGWRGGAFWLPEWAHKSEVGAYDNGHCFAAECPKPLSVPRFFFFFCVIISLVVAICALCIAFCGYYNKVMKRCTCLSINYLV